MDNSANRTILRNMNACYIGLGYIGLPSAVIAAESGITVHGVDADRRVVEQAALGIPLHDEPGLKEKLQHVIERRNLDFSTEATPADVFLLMVPTPLQEGNRADLSHVEAATKSILPILRKGNLYIIESTSPPGTTEAMYQLICRERPDLRDEILVAYCPERILPGKAMEELVYNDRVIGGLNEKSTQAAADFYRLFVKGEIHQTNHRTAELCKLTENAFRDVQVAFANELSLICDSCGIDVQELISIVNTHPRASLLSPGCGVGGHCIAVDPYFLIHAFPEESRLIQAARQTNAQKTEWCYRRIKQAITRHEQEHGASPVVAVLGLSYKANVDDLRESPALRIASSLVEEFGNSRILMAEPNISSHPSLLLTDYRSAFERADIVVFLQAHREFKTLPLRTDKQILDFCGVC